MTGGGWLAGAELRAVIYFISSFPFLLEFDVGAKVLSFACSSPVGSMPFGVSGLLLLL